MNAQFADDARRFWYPYLKVGFLIASSLLFGTLAILVALAFKQPWWTAICVGAGCTGCAGAFLFAAATYVHSIRTP
ncbi:MULTISPECIES: hypothetical protein [Streptomyces]|uniref:hypothetical protein n=1 Tax=Streptomyces TaxID=1883 RepID=UPI001FCAC4DD|nr:hypothetical protein [Streptomyces seoulensis]BDH07052.1 hypothetical protein HEK131_42790 [Streptomyces seoulensis]